MSKSMGIRQVLIHINKIALGAEKPETLEGLWRDHVSNLSKLEQAILMWIVHRAFNKNTRLFSRDIGSPNKDHQDKKFEHFIESLYQNSQSPDYLMDFNGHSPWVDANKTLRLSYKIKFFGTRRCALGLPALRLLKGIEKGQTLMISPKHFTIKNGVIHPR